MAHPPAAPGQEEPEYEYDEEYDDEEEENAPPVVVDCGSGMIKAG